MIEKNVTDKWVDSLYDQCWDLSFQFIDLLIFLCECFFFPHLMRMKFQAWLRFDMLGQGLECLVPQSSFITLFKSLIVFSGTNNTPHVIPYI